MVMYAVVSSRATSSLWPTAIKKLSDKYELKWPGKVLVISYEGDDVGSCLTLLKDLRPAYCCFVAHHSECSRDFVHSVHHITRSIDPTNPFCDTVWGILTGLVEDDLLFALDQPKLVVRRVLTSCPVELAQFESGDWYSEIEACTHYKKASIDSEVQKSKCPQDTTKIFADALSEWHDKQSAKGLDMIITSGHATESNWELGYNYTNGRFVCQSGALVGLDCDGSQHHVKHDGKAKILSAAGNCLMGHINDGNCMAVAWMHSAAVVQMIGYLVPTWFGYGGWGVNKYFVNTPGMFTFAEAFFANQQSLLAQLHCPQSAPGDHNMQGLMHDRDEVVFYGDPAWDARLLAMPDKCPYDINITLLPSDESLGPEWKVWKLTVQTKTAGSWDCPTADDKFTSPGRPPVYIFPQSAKSYKLLQGTAILNCRCVLIPLSGAIETSQRHNVVFALLN